VQHAPRGGIKEQHTNRITPKETSSLFSEIPASSLKYPPSLCTTVRPLSTSSSVRNLLDPAPMTSRRSDCARAYPCACVRVEVRLDTYQDYGSRDAHAAQESTRYAGVTNLKAFKRSITHSRSILKWTVGCWRVSRCEDPHRHIGHRWRYCRPILQH
jgi:hypothetical protein